MESSELPSHDQMHLLAAEGWLELGDLIEANDELEQITPALRAHPLVLRVRWGVYSKAGKWEMAIEIARAIAEALPSNSWGFIHWAFSLHELNRTDEARNVLLPVIDKFPDDATIQYNMACYCCQLGDLKEAWQWLERVFDLEGKKDMRLVALDDPDLEPLWNEISAV